MYSVMQLISDTIQKHMKYVCTVLQQKGIFCGQFQTFHLKSVVVHLYNDSERNGWWKGIE